MPELPEDIIDFHVHLFPDRLFEAVWKYFSNDYGWDVMYRLYYREVIAFLKKRRVRTIVYSNYAHKKGVARALNEWNLRVLDENPDLYCFAAYHPADDDGPEMAEMVLSHPRVLGLKLQLLVQRFYPYDERMLPVYELVMKKHKRVLLHVGTGPVGNEFVGAAHFKRLLDIFPRLPAIVAHMGTLEYREFIELVDSHPSLYMDTSFSFLPKLPVRFDLGGDVLESHRERILYGSDFPNLLFPYEDEIHCLLGLGLSQDFYDKVFFENGRHIIEHCGRPL